MLPTKTLRQIKDMNFWCGNGRRRATKWHRSIGRPEHITAYDIIRALRIQERSGYIGHDRVRAINAAIRIMDVETANAVMAEMKRRRLPTRYIWGNERRRYPARITRGRQLRALLDTFQDAAQTSILHDVLKARSEG